MSEFILPNLGDGVAQGDVLKVLVKVGDALAVDQPVLELETDKATIEVPSNVAGKVKEIRVKAGDKVKPGRRCWSWRTARAGHPPPLAQNPQRAPARLRRHRNPRRLRPLSQQHRLQPAEPQNLNPQHPPPLARILQRALARPRRSGRSAAKAGLQSPQHPQNLFPPLAASSNLPREQPPPR